jgi:hypothetical protein
MASATRYDASRKCCARREIVKELVAAMNDMSEYQDKVEHFFRQQWLLSNGETTSKHFPSQSKEKQCWFIRRYACDVYEHLLHQ